MNSPGIVKLPPWYGQFSFGILNQFLAIAKLTLSQHF